MLDATYFLLWIFVIFLLLLSIGVLAEVKRLRLVGVARAPSPLPLDTLAPMPWGIDLRTGKRTHARAFHDRDHVVLFVSPNCTTCQKLVRSVVAGSERSLVIVCRGDSTTCQSAFGFDACSGILVFIDPNNEMGSEYGINGTPMAVVVSGHKVRGYGRPTTDEELQYLCRRILGRPRCEEAGLAHTEAVAIS